MIRIIRGVDGVQRKISDTYSVNNLLTAEHNDKMSIAVSSAQNHDEITKTTSDRAYYVLEGQLQIQDQIAKSGDVVFVPANTEYHFKGTFKAVLINAPPFKKGNESISRV